jgi:hypothetical protein
MPRLILFAVCEKVILDGAGNASIINVVHGMEVAVSQQGPIVGPIPRNAVAPNPWSTYAVWKPTPGDTGKEFLQKIDVLWLDGTIFNTIATPFKFDGNRNHQNTANVLGFPVGQVGDVTFNMWLECDRKRIGEIHSWIITVTHKQMPN